MTVGTRAVVTALGAVTPCGLTMAENWDAVVAGRSGIGLLRDVDVSDMTVAVGGEVRGFAPLEHVPRSDARRLDRHALYAIAAADEAMCDVEIADPYRFAITVATGSGAVSLTHEATRRLDADGPRRVPPGVVVYGGPDAAAAYLSQKYDARGASVGTAATCASGTVALGDALRMIRHGYADAVLVVAADDCLNRVNLAVNSTLGALAPGYAEAPQSASRPFDRDRSGFVMSAGAAALLVESEEHARRRGATGFAELAGYGTTSDAHHPTAPRPDGSGAAEAMRLALADAAVSVDAVDFLSAHATGTPQGDAAEAAAVQRLFGSHAASLPLSATKSTTGHLLGATGALEAAFTVLSMRDGVIPPTLNLDHSDFPDLNIVTEPRDSKIEIAMSNSFGFGGHNATIVFRRR
ncbi:beta-ketoacyl-[acyl-carrier-protein] synthase family protein [Paramicrobacterium sp. CJ85]|uniref:beta-ketoacyl-[acyl-carrier-protein] synthase family protein n=1 Tax=Paramicrobacterium sp. CJ85 TaxID=3445355 RepID=UPI003F627E21